tara:strand:- start:480 stop:1100 length:621 start_codon:yes stop_codon:yes gene_type:complete
MDRFKRIIALPLVTFVRLWRRWPRWTFWLSTALAVTIFNGIYDRLVIQSFEPHCWKFHGKQIGQRDSEPEGFEKTDSPISAFRWAIKGKVSDEYAEGLQRWFDEYDIPYRRRGNRFFFSNVGFDEADLLDSAYLKALWDLAEPDRTLFVSGPDGPAYTVGIPRHLEAYEKNKPQHVRDMYRKFGSSSITDHCELARVLIVGDWPRS